MLVDAGVDAILITLVVFGIPFLIMVVMLGLERVVARALAWFETLIGS